MTYNRYYAQGMIEDKSGPLQIKSVTATVSGTGQTVVSAVSGKILRVIAGFISTDTADAGVLFLTSATAVTAWIFPGLHDTFPLDPNLLGWFETVASDPLKATKVTGDVYVSLRYVEVTP